MKRDVLFKFAVLSVLFSVFLLLSVRCMLFFTGDIVFVFDEKIGEVLFAWKHAKVSLSIPIACAGGFVFALTEIAIHRFIKKRNLPIKLALGFIAIVCALVIFAIFFLALLFTCKINQVPFSVFFEIVFDLMGQL